ncbi:Hint domain-containing protein [Psychromarinibacter sp. C21-152]|uniref:Hint domain-containing protein n=1 Tax=Psychromarinibacter sediminicola TaxID=3033385 RepID=A0AAE3T7V3_9RHOB|nr:Hint domain-containing protein [Psychromarinibacter sediminicola]MDF0600725.1 Hint domain-containing protein [Psychromarinibacter sediminicola]
MPLAHRTEETPHALPLMAGTLIDVDGGRKPVEELQVGDLVRTKDNGLQPVRWIAARTLDAAALAADPTLRPIRIRAGALGEAKPARDLIVSPQHCVLLDDWRCQLLFGEDEVLATAQALLNDHSITVDHGARAVTYYHFMFDRHEIVYSNGAETESFHPGQARLGKLDAAKRAELFKLFPELAHDLAAYGPQARATLKPYEAEVLIAM